MKLIVENEFLKKRRRRMGHTGSIRLDSALIDAARSEGAIQKRSISKQIEHWAEVGKSIASKINPTDLMALSQGLVDVKMEPITSVPIDPNDVFNALENDRKNKTLSQKVTSARYYYESSETQPGLLDRVDTKTGKRRTGEFKNGKFKAVKSLIREEAA
jgi:hypothetical protein